MSRHHDTDLKVFLGSTTKILPEVSLFFENLGIVRITSLTRTNLSLARRVADMGYPGIIISCPDFEREAIALAFLAAFQHLLDNDGLPGIHEAKAGETAAIGDCVVEITRADQNEVHFVSANETIGYERSYYEFPLVHTAKPSAKLTPTHRMKRRSSLTVKEAEQVYEAYPTDIRKLLDQCGKRVPAIGLVTSPSQYLNEPPTHIAKGYACLGRKMFELGRVLPITYVDPDGDLHNSFKWPFDAPPSILVGPRVDGSGSTYEILNQKRAGQSINLVSLDIPSPDSLEALTTDLLDLADEHVGVVGFCDRWTLDRMKNLQERGFLLFDWGDCTLADTLPNPCLSVRQSTIRSGSKEKIVPVYDGDTNLTFIKHVIYDIVDPITMNTDEANDAKQDLFYALGAAIRMTEAPDEDYSRAQRAIIRQALNVIGESRTLSRDDFSDLTKACNALAELFEPWTILPKEERIYDLLCGILGSRQQAQLVVDRNRIGQATSYWNKRMENGGYSTEGLTIMTTRDFMMEKGTSDPYANVIFCGWYDRGTMDRALHSGIASSLYLVLYTNPEKGLELDWALRATRQWASAQVRRERSANQTLRELEIKGKVPSKATVVPASSHSDSNDTNASATDDSPLSHYVTLGKAKLSDDVARPGETSVRATPVLFNDGSHVWLRAPGAASGGGRLVVITECLGGKQREPSMKPARSLLSGDVVLRTQSDKAYIQEASERRVEGYDATRDVARAWQEPIVHARRFLDDSEIIKRLQRATGKSYPTVKGWVTGKDTQGGARIAPRSADDIRAIFTALGMDISDERVEQIMLAARRVRGQHQVTGRIAARQMVDLFLEDVASVDRHRELIAIQPV